MVKMADHGTPSSISTTDKSNTHLNTANLQAEQFSQGLPTLKVVLKMASVLKC